MQVEPTPSSSKAPEPNGTRGLVHEGVASGLEISLHPLPVLSISDHFTRTRLNTPSTSKQAVQVFGALLGTQTGRQIEIVNSFEFAVGPPSASSASSSSEGELLVDHGFFKTRQDQFKQVFPTLDFMGWYAVGTLPTPVMLSLHTQLLTYSESPLLLLLSPTPTPSASSNSNKTGAGAELPISIFEPSTEIVKGEAQSMWIRCGYAVETGEAERVAVDGVAKPSGSLSGRGQDNPLVANLTTQRNALDMLHQRIKSILLYLDQVSAGKAPFDHEVMRQIASLAASLPAASGEGREEGANGFREEYLREYNDVLLTSYLSSQTKSLNSVNDLFDRYTYLLADRSNSGGGGAGGRGGGGDGRHDRMISGGSHAGPSGRRR